MADTPLHAKCGEYRGLEGHMSEETIPIRLSHLLRECSVGSIVRGEQYLVAVNDARSWYPKEQVPTAIQYVERVKNALGISEELRPPPTARITDEGKIEGTWIPRGAVSKMDALSALWSAALHSVAEQEN